MNLKKNSYLLITILNFDLSATFNRSLFYRVSSFYEEPRLEKAFLTTIESEISGGSSSINNYKNSSKANFNLVQADFNLYQNFCKGFFCHFHLPVEATEISYKKNIKKNEDFGLSDSTLFFGYTRNYQETTYLDYIDFTFKTGVLFPTGKSINNLSKQLNRIPYGYNGHWAIPFQIDLSAGACDWLTFGAHADILTFFKKEKKLKFKDLDLCANINPGAVFRVGTYLRADHFIVGISMLIGLTYEQQNRAKFTSPEAINNIREHLYFKRWHRTILHFLFEYDRPNCEKDRSLNIGLIYNLQVEGKNVFKTNMLAGYMGLNLGWNY